MTARRRIAIFAALAALIEVAAWCQALLAAQLVNFAPASDFRAYYVAAWVARDHGWSHLYDRAEQLHEMAVRWPGSPPLDYISPPAIAWLVYPLTLLSPSAAYYVFAAATWIAILVASQLAAPPGWPWRLAFACLALGLIPAASAVVYGQATGFVLLSLTAGWRLAERRPGGAGAALAGIALKPQLAIAVPLCLVAARRWRTLAGVALVGAGLLVASLLTIGWTGLVDMVRLEFQYTSDPSTHLWSLPALLGGGPLTHLAPLLVVAVAAATAFVTRQSATVFALGVTGSLLAAEYLHGMDLAVYLLPIWVSLRSGSRLLAALAALLWSVMDIAVAYPAPATIAAALLFAGLVVTAIRPLDHEPGPGPRLCHHARGCASTSGSLT